MPKSNNRSKVHSQCNVLESSPNHPHPQSTGKIVFYETGPWLKKRLRTAVSHEYVAKITMKKGPLRRFQHLPFNLRVRQGQTHSCGLSQNRRGHRERRERGELREQHWHICTVMCEIGNQEEAAVREGKGSHSSALAWKIPGTEEPGGLRSMGSLRVGHD